MADPPEGYIDWHHKGDPIPEPLLRVTSEGRVFIRGEETDNPWVVGRAYLEWVREFAIAQQEGGFEDYF